ncbi:hypothetical protein PAL_GLEAN10022710 [Pteropus alecto]|uniref:Uncharacterized protein n=1 Tax=Pteropus alecto TaxID=9402 RepID=L5K7N2_PTEAL|nr:hypothetical protein PAL_GLEAN10022710 [Pteropus alecto]
MQPLLLLTDPAGTRLPGAAHRPRLLRLPPRPLPADSRALPGHPADMSAFLAGPASMPQPHIVIIVTPHPQSPSLLFCSQ